jgi:hypothetical protein
LAARDVLECLQQVGTDGYFLPHCTPSIIA